MDSVTKLLFEDLPFIKKLDGYKRKLGNWTILIGAVASAGLYAAPQLAILYPGITWLDKAVIGLGVVLKVCGDIHAQAKEETKE